MRENLYEIFYKISSRFLRILTIPPPTISVRTNRRHANPPPPCAPRRSLISQQVRFSFIGSPDAISGRLSLMPNRLRDAASIPTECVSVSQPQGMMFADMLFGSWSAGDSGPHTVPHDPPPVHKLPRHTGLRRSTGPPLRTPSLRSSPPRLDPNIEGWTSCRRFRVPQPATWAPAWLETLAFLFLSRGPRRWKGDARNSQTGTRVSPTKGKLETAHQTSVCFSDSSYYLVSFFLFCAGTTSPSNLHHCRCSIFLIFSRHRIPHMFGAFRRSIPKQIPRCYS